MKFFGSALVKSVRNGISDYLNRNKDAPSLVVTPGLPATLRTGMWAYSASLDHVGIVVGVKGDLVEFHSITPDRLTASVGYVPVSDLRQARRSEIPATSRPDAIKAERMGYL